MAIQICTAEGAAFSSNAERAAFCEENVSAIEDYVENDLQDLVDGVTTEINEDIALFLFLVDTNIVDGPTAQFATWEEYRDNYIVPLIESNTEEPELPAFDL